MTTQVLHPYHWIENLPDLLAAIPDESIVSRIVYKDDQVNVTLFAFAAGESLSEHTAAVPAILHILSGEATLELGGETFEGQANTWLHMDARLPHSIVARTPLIMLLILLKGAVPAQS